MNRDLEIAYLGVEVADRPAFDTFLADVIGLVPGEPTADGAHTWRDDAAAQRVLVQEGPSNDATVVGFEATDAAACDGVVERGAAAGFPFEPGTTADLEARRVEALARTTSPWGVPVEPVRGLARSGVPFESPLVPGGFLTEGVGFGHVVFATTAFDDAHRFATEVLGMAQSDWVEVEIAPGIELEVRFYHCNPRHHSLAIAKAPFDLPQHLHHLMLEARERDDVGLAFDRAWAAGQGFANGLGRHDNDGMFSFYVPTPAVFQIEFGHGARLITDDWDDNRRYDRISAGGHQPIEPS